MNMVKSRYGILKLINLVVLIIISYMFCSCHKPSIIVKTYAPVLSLDSVEFQGGIEGDAIVPDRFGFIHGYNTDLSVDHYKGKSSCDPQGHRVRRFSSTELIRMLTDVVKPGDEYYYRAYAEFNGTVYYGEVVSFIIPGGQGSGGNQNTGGGQGSTGGGNSSYVRMTLSSATATKITLNLEMSSDIDFCYVHEDAVKKYSYNKYYGDKPVSIGYLRPSTEYTVYALPVYKDGHEGTAVFAHFSTTAPPYTNYFAYGNTIYKINSVQTRVDTGGNWDMENLIFKNDDKTYFQFAQRRAGWLPIEYRINPQSDWDVHGLFYESGKKKDYNMYGKLEINRQTGNITTFDFNITDSYHGEEYFGHAEVKDFVY